MIDLFEVNVLTHRFNQAAPHYAQHARVQAQSEQTLLEQIALLKQAPTQILDVGCGAGSLLRALKKRYPRAKVFGLDLAFNMLQHAKRSAAWFRSPALVCADSAVLPFADHSFDLVVSNFMLHWCPDISKVLMELGRVLKPDSPLFMTTLGSDTLKEFRDLWQTLDDRPHIHPFLDLYHLGDGLLACGFKDPVLDRSEQVVYFKTVKEAIYSLKAIGAQNALRRRRRTLTGVKRMQAFFKAYETYQKSEGFPVSYEIIYLHAWSKINHISKLIKQNISSYSISLSDLKKKLK